jgi:hypothetical protein
MADRPVMKPFYLLGTSDQGMTWTLTLDRDNNCMRIIIFEGDTRYGPIFVFTREQAKAMLVELQTLIAAGPTLGE